MTDEERKARRREYARRYRAKHPEAVKKTMRNAENTTGNIVMRCLPIPKTTAKDTVRNETPIAVSITRTARKRKGNTITNTIKNTERKSLKERLNTERRRRMKKAIKTVLAVVLAILLLSTETMATTIPAITEPCGMTAEELDEHLKGDLVGYAGAFLQAEEDYGINACFLASVAALESSWGRSKVAQNKNNIFGWTKTGGGYKEFDSFESCIDWCSWKIKKKYINKGLDTISKIAPIYCDEEWAEIVTEIYGGMYK